VKRTLLVVGSGGREHALVWKLAQSPLAGKIYVAPGNAGTAALAENVPIAVTDTVAMVAFAQKRRVDLTVVTPDDPLAAGMVDALQAAGLKAFGPVRRAAEIEASKAFAKRLMSQQGIPTARYETFSEAGAAREYAARQHTPLVVKASGLALGKGVFVCPDRPAAEQAIAAIMADKVSGAAGAEVVIEEFLEGPEVSIHALSDGTTFQLFPTAQDHKPIGEGDTGPNTGGMGTIAPVPGFGAETLAQAGAMVVQPALDGLRADGRQFSGLLYPGLIITADGPKVLEFNARFGDPETQSYMRLLESDLVEVLEACASGRLETIKLQWAPGYAVCIVLAAGGYPGDYSKGLPIDGVEAAAKQKDVIIFQAGTKLEAGQLKTAGGRVLGVTATGDTLQQALDKAYAAVKLISFEGMQYRRDIGRKALNA
jgi:phosphoribosylamine--glycine ligase